MSCTYAAATANPAIPQKFMGSLNASLRYFRSNLGNSIGKATSYTDSFFLIAASAVLTTSRRRCFAFSGKSLWCRGTRSSSQQPHVAFVREQLVRQLHVQRLAFNFLHLRIDGCGAELHLRFCCRGTAVDLVAHLIER